MDLPPPTPRSSSTLTYAWDLDGNGYYGDTDFSARFGAEVGIKPTFVAPVSATDASFPISLRVTDAAGMVSYAFTTLTVHHTKPHATITAPNQLFATVPAVFTLSATPQRSPFDYSINFGDDITADVGSVNGSPYPVNHQYAQPGTYTITVIATDNAGADSAPFTLQVTVAPRPTKLLTESGILVVTANNAQNDITIDKSNGNLRLNLNNVITTYPLTDVKSLDIQTGNGNNLIDADVDIPKAFSPATATTPSPPVTPPTRFLQPAETIPSTAAAEMIPFITQVGNSTINAGTGQDNIFCNGGDNHITAQSRTSRPSSETIPSLAAMAASISP